MVRSITFIIVLHAEGPPEPAEALVGDIEYAHPQMSMRIGATTRPDLLTGEDEVRAFGSLLPENLTALVSQQSARIKRKAGT